MKNLLTIVILGLIALTVSSATVGVEYTPLIGGGILLASLAIPPAESGVLLMSIPIQDARSLFTKKLIDVYKEMITPMTFLRSFFKVEESLTKEISIEVRRGTERVAVDVTRHTDGNMNTFSNSSEKIFIPPFYYEFLAANDHRLYDVAIGMQSETGFAQLTKELAEDLLELQYKIERAYELQCAQVLETGIVQLQANTNIDFKRKAASLVDKGAGNYWATGTVNPYTDLENMCKFIRQTGKTRSGIYNAIMGSEALADFLDNTIVKARADIRNITLDDIKTPQTNAEGGVLHGEVTAGSYKVRIWTYPEGYEDASGNFIEYVNSKKVIMLPDNPRFKLAFGAIPMLLEDQPETTQRGAFVVQEYFDRKKTIHEIAVKSAGVAIPVAVDQVVTYQVVAA
jgi:hypothetical protein